MLSRFRSQARHNDYRRRMLLGASLATIATAVLLALPAFAAARHGPDLKVKVLAFQPTPARVIVDHNGDGVYKIHFKVVNVGDRPAPASETSVHVIASGNGKLVRTPALNVGGARNQTVHQSSELSVHGRPVTGLGFRTMAVCADYGIPEDVHETNERNNCKKVQFRAIPRTWLVTSFTRSGRKDDPTPKSDEQVSTETAPGMRFDFEAVVREAGSGTRDFIWLARGGVTEFRSGVGGGTGEPGPCEDGGLYSGQGNVAHSPWDFVGQSSGVPEGYFQVSFDMSDYFAYIGDPSYQYTITGPCVNASSLIDPLLTPNTVGEFVPQNKVQQGQSTDRGELGNGTEPVGTYTNTWVFKADVPGG